MKINYIEMLCCDRLLILGMFQTKLQYTYYFYMSYATNYEQIKHFQRGTFLTLYARSSFKILSLCTYHMQSVTTAQTDGQTDRKGDGQTDTQAKTNVAP